MKRPESTCAGPGRLALPERVAVVRGVNMFFNDSGLLRALTEVNFEVRQGEVLGLLGPKGSGKSTALRILAGRLSPTEGRVRVFGRSPRRAAARARIGYLPEKAGHDRPFGFAGLVQFFKERVARTLGRQSREAGESRDREHRRHCLAQALHGGRDLLILDEPFSGLDSTRSHELKEIIRKLAGRGKTVVLSSDSLSEAKDICSRVAIFSEGRIQAAGALSELLATADAMRFIGPVLPRALAERLVKGIRKDLNGEITFSETAVPESEKAGRDPVQTAGPIQTLPATTIAEKVLAPLMKPARPAPQPKPLPENPDPVNHEKLAELTKPATPPAESRPEPA